MSYNYITDLPPTMISGDAANNATVHMIKTGLLRLMFLALNGT